MADTEPQPGIMKAPSQPTHRAGGGLPSFEDVRVEEIKPVAMPYLQQVFNQHADPSKKTWTKDSIIQFLHNTQADKVTDPSGDMTSQDELDFAGFLRYMSSTAANIHAPLPEQDLSWPLTSYFVSSSHNTYLSGNQLTSESDADAYKTVLLRGCRCVEIDVWDGEDSDSDHTSVSSSDEESKDKRKIRKTSRKEQIASKMPESLTSRLEKTSIGRRFTTKLKGSSPSTTETTKQDGARTSTDTELSGGAPVKKVSSPQSMLVEPRVLHGWTLTKEVPFREVCEAIRDHAFTVSDLPLIISIEVHCCHQQQERMVDIMKEVWSDLLVQHPEQETVDLPPPGDLRGKILVKVKYMPQKQDSISPVQSVKSDQLTVDSNKADNSKTAKPPKIIESLSTMGVFTRGITFKSLTQPEAKMPTHMFSLSEGTVADVFEQDAQGLFDHNKHYMMRTYPSGMRINSSNLDPQVFWRKGIQIVALNWQKWDEGMMLNEGMFAGSGGFVLKPVGYRGRKPIAAPTSETTSAPVAQPVAQQPTSQEPNSTNTAVGQKVGEPGSVPTTAAAPTPAAATTTTLPPPAPAPVPVSLPLGAEPDMIHSTVTLSIKVLAAQNLPLPHHDDKISSFRPYVKVELHTEMPHTLLKHESAKAKEGEYKAKTKVNKDATIDPDFKGEVLNVAKEVGGVIPELAFVRFLVKDDEIGRDGLSAWACMRLDRLKSGLRWVHLFSRDGRVSGGVLLVEVEKILA